MFNHLRGRLMQLGLNQTTAGRRLGLSQPAMSARMTGRTPWSLDEMYQLLDICHAPAAELPIYFPRGGQNNE